MKDILTRNREKFYFEIFRTKLDNWKELEKGNTNEKFASLICDFYEEKEGKECKCTEKYVSSWYKGKMFPEKYREAIAQVLGVDEEDFFPTLELEKKLFEETQVKEEEKKLFDYAQGIGLDENFLKFILLSELKESLPVQTIVHYTGKKSNDLFGVDYETELFQIINNEGHIQGIEEADIRYMKELQEEIKDFIIFKMGREKKRLESELLSNEEFGALILETMNLKLD